MQPTSLSKDQADLLAKSIESATLRRTDFLKSLPHELSKREDEIQARLSKENASPRSKLRKIYNLMTDLGHAAEPYIACGKGCSSCCKMNITISQFEANLISEKTGFKSKQFAHSQNHSPDEFIGIPCLFLKDDSCSIYNFRPFMCRKHVWFDTTPYWCDPERSLDVAIPMIEYSGALGAFLEVTKNNSGGIYADIRDFFN